MKYGRRPQFFENGRQPQFFLMEDDLYVFENIDNYNYFQMENNLNILLNGRQHIFSLKYKTTIIFFSN